MAAAADTSDKAQMAKANDATDSARIGWAFLSQYYSYLNKDPARLHCFYTKRSTLIHSTEGEDTVACYGQSEIHEKIMSLGFDDCKVYISNVDSQSSAEHGIIVQVIGEMSNSNGPWRKFAQTFFLAEQPNGYFVLNDICRYIKEEGDEEVPSSSSAPAETPNQNSTSTAPQQPEASSTSTPVTDSNTDTAPASVESVLFNDVKPPVAKEEKKEKEEEVTPKAVPSESEVAAAPQQQQPNGQLTNGDVEKPKEEEEKAVVVEPLSAVEHKSNEPAADEEKKIETPAAPAIEEVKKVEKEEAAITPDIPAVEEKPVPPPAAETSTPQSSSSSSAPSTSTPAPAPAPAPTPAAPAAPKSWASLAASGPTKWGSLNKTAAAQKPAESVSTSTPSPAAASSSNAQQPSSSSSSSAPASQFTEQVQAVQHSNCFVKGVLEYVTEKQLKEVLTTRFGPLKELDIIRSKACAFVEFVSLNDARKAIQVSMRHQDGGENGIIFETPTGEKARINVVERKPHNERPPPKPRSNTQNNSESGAAGGGGGGQGGGKGGQQRDGQGQRNQGGRTGGQRNQGGRTGGGGGQQGARTGGGRQQQQQAKQ
ncbi:hypothetical protein JCM5350_007673 [Sporobolomyces pararoseus]